MNQISIAKPQENVAVPAFTVETLTEKVTKVLHEWDEKSGRIVAKTVQEDPGYLVKFMRGHSIRVDKHELQRMGFDQTVPLHDPSADDDTVVGRAPAIVKGA